MDIFWFFMGALLYIVIGAVATYYGNRLCVKLYDRLNEMNGQGNKLLVRIKSLNPMVLIAMSIAAILWPVTIIACVLRLIIKYKRIKNEYLKGLLGLA